MIADRDHHLEIAVEKLEVLKNKLVLSDMLKAKSIRLYKKIIEKNIPKGRSMDAMVAATVYAACRDSEIPCTLNDMTEATGITKSSIARCYRAILVTLNLRMPVSDIRQCILRITKNLEMSAETKQRAVTIIDDAKKRNHLAGKDPMGVAAAAIHLASIDNCEKISQGDLARVAMLTEVTIRNRCKGLRSLALK